MMISFNNIGNHRLWENIVACIIIATCYTVSTSWAVHLSYGPILADTILIACILFVLQIILWNIFSYVTPHFINHQQSLILHILYGLVCLLLVLGIETIFIYETFPSSFLPFVDTLPVRAFCIYLLYGVYLFLQRSYPTAEEKNHENELTEERLEEQPPMQEGTIVPIKRITIKTGQRIKVIPVADLLYLKAEDDYVSCVTSEGHWLKTITLKELEIELPSDKFVRVHRSYIVNIDKIINIERYGQKQLLQLTSGESLKISPNGYKTLRTKLNL